MTKNIKGKTILITGASSGIGEETAYQLAKKGAHLILAARRVHELEMIQKRCKKMGNGRINIFPMDLSNINDIDRLERVLTNKNIQIDILINSAGIGYAGSFVQMTDQRIEKILKVNLLGLIYLTKRLALKMIDQEKGQIINLASLAGKVARANHAIYAASKSAVIAFSNSLRLELKSLGIRVTVINFGPVNSPFFDKIEGPEKEKSLNSIFTLETEEAAKIVINTISKNKREVNRPFSLAVASKLYNLFPSLGDHILLKYFNQ